MSESLITAAHYSHLDGVTVSFRGDRVELGKEDHERATKLGAIDCPGGPPATNALEGAYGVNDGGATQGENAPRNSDRKPDIPEGAEDAPQTHNELTLKGGAFGPGGAELQTAVTDPDALSGAELDRAIADAGIDPDSGGSKADGGLTADEKRAALKE